MTDGFAGVTTMRSTGTSCTVIAAVPVFPSDVAVMVVLPTATPVTTPPDETVATEALLVDQVMAAPVTTTPFASRAVATSVVVAPTFRVTVVGATVTEFTGPGGAAATVIVAEPVFPFDVAVIVAVPTDTPVTTPPDETVALEELLVVQVMDAPGTTAPSASRAIAESVVVAPTLTVAVAGVTVTVATGFGVMVTVAVPVFPSLEAVIVAEPAATPVTTPLVETVAIARLLLLQATTRPVRILLLASRRVAVSGTV